ncbi:carbohydrate deacetylase [Candidatus Margulisiibacteriota bacterium]
MHSEKRVIVNADDFGLTEGINRGIQYCFRQGIVRSTSLMAVGPAFEHAVTIAGETPGLGIGCHLTLVEEKPVLPVSMVKSLVNPDGCFVKSFKEFIIRYFTGKINLNEVRLEFEAQIKKVLDSGIKITHLDSHQHLHMLPSIFSMVCKLAAVYNIPAVRLTRCPGWSPKGLVLSFFTGSAKGKLKINNLKAVDLFLGVPVSGGLDKSYLLQAFGKYHARNVEIMSHPGELDEQYINRYTGWNYNPELEKEALTDPEVIGVLEKNNIALINYLDL